MEGEEREINPIDLVSKTETNRMKLLCLQLGNDYKTYKELYENTRLYDVYETLVLMNAINWQPPKEEK